MSKSVYTDAYKLLLEQLIQLRKDKGVTQVELARRLGKTQQFISKLELGVRRLDPVEFYEIVRAVGADPGAVYAEIIQGFGESIGI